MKTKRNRQHLVNNISNLNLHLNNLFQRLIIQFLMLSKRKRNMRKNKRILLVNLKIKARLRKRLRKHSLKEKRKGVLRVKASSLSPFLIWVQRMSKRRILASLKQKFSYIKKNSLQKSFNPSQSGQYPAPLKNTMPSLQAETLKLLIELTRW
jgi:hypothetical protein